MTTETKTEVYEMIPEEPKKSRLDMTLLQALTMSVVVVFAVIVGTIYGTIL